MCFRTLSSHLEVWPQLTSVVRDYAASLSLPVQLLPPSKACSSHTEKKSLPNDPFSPFPLMGSPQTWIKTPKLINSNSWRWRTISMNANRLCDFLCSSPASLANWNGALMRFAFSLFAPSSFFHSMLMRVRFLTNIQLISEWLKPFLLFQSRSNSYRNCEN